MALFAFHCTDARQAMLLRERHLAAHLAHVEAHIDRYAVAGPLTQEQTTTGSLRVLRAEDEAAARRFFETDPYFGAGVWQTIRVSEFQAVAGEWVGGAAWKR